MAKLTPCDEPDGAFAKCESQTDEKAHYQIYVLTRRGRFLVYLDTTTQHLVYDPLVGDTDSTTNYSTIFSIEPAPPDKQPPGAQLAYVFRNYVTPGMAPKLTRIKRHEYRLRMEASMPHYDVFYIQDSSQKPLDPRLIGQTETVTISVPGQDIHWCPINEKERHYPEKRRVTLFANNKKVGDFQLKKLPSVPPPFCVSSKKEN